MPNTAKERNFAKRLRRTYLGIWTRTINGIESGRLDKQLQILERQKLHTVRLVNNDIRLTRVTLDHIEASSGHSINQQGFLGSNADTMSSTNTLDFAAIESGDKPMFLYGERQVSRRVGRFKRIQSAMGKGRSTHGSSGLPMSDMHQRPKSSIPTFREIKSRVKKQLEINPNWDPNIEPPYDPTTEEDDSKIRHAWVSEDRLTSGKVERTKSGKRSSVSWQISRSPPDGVSIVEDDNDVITMVGRENVDTQSESINNNTKNLKKSGIITERSKSANVLKPRNVAKVTVANTISEQRDIKDPPDNARRKTVKSATARLERSHVSAPKPRNPRDHPMLKVVGRINSNRVN